MDFDFKEYKFTCTFDNLIAISTVALALYVGIVVVSAMIRDRLVRFLKLLKKKVGVEKSKQKEERKQKK